MQANISKTGRMSEFRRPSLLLRCWTPRIAIASTHLRLYTITHSLWTKQKQIAKAVETHDLHSQSDELTALEESTYPRIVASQCVGLEDFRKLYGYLKTGETVNGSSIKICGRIHSLRTSGNALRFVDVAQDGQWIQAISDSSVLSGSTHLEIATAFKDLRRGDIISVCGRPHRNQNGVLSILLSNLPKLLSVCLHPIPRVLLDEQTRKVNRHIDFLVNPQARDIIRLRSQVINYIRQFLIDQNHVEIQTPILAEGAGGALARPFLTTSTEFTGRELCLRVAPELWLKRLVIGGFDRVFEIGPSFRNEGKEPRVELKRLLICIGLDLAHNPEFTTCEFYRTYADLEELIETTERMICGLAKLSKLYKSLNSKLSIPSSTFPRLDFIPELEAAINRPLPDLASQGALAGLIQIFTASDIALPRSPTLPRLLDKLSTLYLEPKCSNPTFIINHPECLSPLSKSFFHPKSKQRVAARAELFIKGREIVNTYEEENSPSQQRRKFEAQLLFREENSTTSIDENYLQALEWGLPPTGGWGCGIDRLCMLLSGTNRIGDVLPFGTLRNVVSLGHSNKTAPIRSRSLSRDFVSDNMYENEVIAKDS